MQELEALGLGFARFSELPPKESADMSDLVDGHILTSHTTIEFANLQELVRFVDQWDRVVMWPDAIEIYDTYRE
mgnify:CR=1 FL=1